MFRKNNLLFFSFLLIFFGCENPKTPPFYFTENGLKYKYHDIVTDGEKPKSGDYLNMYMEWKTLADSVFYSSINNKQFGIESFRLKRSEIKGGIHEGFSSITEGDSVTFYASPIHFYRYYLDTIPPGFLNKEKQIKITIRLISIHDSIGQMNFKKEQFLKMSMKEEYIIEDIKQHWYDEYDTILQYGDVFIVPLNTSKDHPIQNEDRVIVDYSCQLYNGTVFYSTFLKEPDEFEMGPEGQMLEGFKYVLQQLCYKDHVLAMIPSYMGFGPIGSSDGKIPPYSPLIFEIKVMGKLVN